MPKITREQNRARGAAAAFERSQGTRTTIGKGKTNAKRNPRKS